MGAKEKPMTLPTTEQHAREILGMPPEWTVVIWETHGTTVKLTGAVILGTFKRGPRKGERDWRTHDPATRNTITITEKRHAAWLAKWERKTRKCHKCAGSGQEWAGWSAKDGTLRRDCRQCNATGTAPHLIADEVTP